MKILQQESFIVIGFDVPDRNPTAWQIKNLGRKDLMYMILYDLLDQLPLKFSTTKPKS